MGETEAGCAFGDQRPVPRSLTRQDLAPSRVEGQHGRPEVPGRPGPLGLEQPQQVKEVLRRVRGAVGQPPRHLVELGQQTGALVTFGGASLGGEREPAQHVEPGGGVQGLEGCEQRLRGRGVPAHAVGIIEDGGGDRMRDERMQQRCRVVAEAVDRLRLAARGGVFAAQHAGQPAIAVEPLTAPFAAGPPDEGQPRLHLGDEFVQRRRAVEQALDRRVVGVTGVRQVATGEQPLAGAPSGFDAALDRLEPAALEREHEARLRGLGLVAARLAQRQDPPVRPVPGGVVAAHRHGGEGGVARRADEGAARAVLEPDPHRLETEPCDRDELRAQVGRRQERVDQPRRREQRRVADLRALKIVGGLEPTVEVLELRVDIGGASVRRQVDPERPQRVRAELERLGNPLPVREAVHLHRRGIGALQRRGGEALDHEVLGVRLIQTRQAVQRGVAGSVRLDQRGGFTWVDQAQGCCQQRVHQPVVADQRGLVGRAPKQVRHPSPLRRVVERVDHGQVLLGRDGEELRLGGEPPCHRQLDAASPRWRKPGHDRLMDAVVAEAHRLTPPRLHHQEAVVEGGRQPFLHDAGGLAAGGLQNAQLGPPSEACHRLDHLPRRHRQGVDARRRYARGLGLVEMTPDRRVVPPPSRGRGRQQPVAAQSIEQLDGLVRVAGRLALDRPDEAGRGVAFHVQRLGDHRDEARPG